MDVSHVASLFLLSSGKSNCDPSHLSRPTAPQSNLNRYNHNFLHKCAAIILLFTSLTEISSCFLQLSKKSIRTRVKSLRLFHLCTLSPSKATLPKPLRNLLTRRCSFSWMESRYSCTLTSNSPGRRKKKDRETDTNDYWPPSLSSGAPPPCRCSSPLRACRCSWMNQPNICVSMKTSRKRRTVLDGMALRKPSRWKKQGTGEEEEDE